MPVEKARVVVPTVLPPMAWAVEALLATCQRRYYYYYFFDWREVFLGGGGGG